MILLIFFSLLAAVFSNRFQPSSNGCPQKGAVCRGEQLPQKSKRTPATLLWAGREKLVYDGFSLQLLLNHRRNILLLVFQYVTDAVEQLSGDLYDSDLLADFPQQLIVRQCQRRIFSNRDPGSLDQDAA